MNIYDFLTDKHYMLELRMEKQNTNTQRYSYILGEC